MSTTDIAEQADPAGDGAVAGPLLAVCGLCGGAGASTLAYLVARHTAGDDDRPVLVCDTGGPTGGLAAYARVSTPRSLPRIADLIAAHEPLADGVFAAVAPGLRLIASAPEPFAEGDENGAARLLLDARKAHALTVVDCGTLGRNLDRVALAAATHVAWVLPATPSGVRRAGPVLAQFVPDPARRELVVARRDVTASKSSFEDLQALVDARPAPLILMPQVPDLGERHPERALEEAAVTLDAIAMELRR